MIELNTIEKTGSPSQPTRTKKERAHTGKPKAVLCGETPPPPRGASPAEMSLPHSTGSSVEKMRKGLRRAAAKKNSESRSTESIIPEVRELILDQVLLEGFRGRPRQVQEELLEMFKESARLKFESQRAKYFIPNGKQEEFIRLIGEHKENGHWIFLFSAANSTGKSAVGINVIANAIWGKQNEWFDYALFREDWPYPKKFWYISTQDTLKSFITGVDDRSTSEVGKWFPRGRYEVFKSGYEYYSRLVTDNGWDGAFKTFDQDPDQFEATKIGIAVFDEPPPESLFNAVLARLTMGGIILFVMTPLAESAWTLERLIEQPSKDVAVLHADIEIDNCRQHAKRGFLQHDQIQRIISQYDEDEVDARAHGQYTHIKNIIYRLDAIANRHNRPWTSFSQADYKIINVCDPHDSEPVALAWFAIDRWLNVYAIKEFPSEEEGFPPYNKIKLFRMSTPEVCHKIMRLETEAGWRPDQIVRVMDPNFGTQTKGSVGVPTWVHYAKCGREIGWPIVYFTNVNDSLEDGHRMVRDWLKDDGDGHSRFKIGENCTNMWYHMTHYAKDVRRGLAFDKHGPGERVQQKYKHFADLVRYLFMFLMAPPPMQREKTAKEKWDEQQAGITRPPPDWRIDW